MYPLLAFAERVCLYVTYSFEQSLIFSIALSSAADLSLLEICSRTSTSRETWSVILKVSFNFVLFTLLLIISQGGKKLYYGAAVRWRREKPGTTVCVRDAFYNVCSSDQ